MTDDEYINGLLTVSGEPTVTCPECGAACPVTSFIAMGPDSDVDDIIAHLNRLIEASSESRQHLHLFHDPAEGGCDVMARLYGTHFTGWDHEELAETP